MSEPFFSAPQNVLSRAGLNAQVILALYELNRVVHHLTFPVTPNAITFYSTARVTPIQTIGGMFNSDFGSGYPVITVQGNTGYWTSRRGNLDGQPTDGYSTYKAIYQYFYLDYFALEASNLNPSKAVRLHFTDTYSGRHYVVKPYQDIQFQQSADSPMTWDYTLTYIVLSELSASSQFAKVANPTYPYLPQNQEDASRRKASTAVHSLMSVTEPKRSEIVLWAAYDGESVAELLASFFHVQISSQVVNEVVRLNHLSDPNDLYKGQAITFPQNLLGMAAVA